MIANQNQEVLLLHDSTPEWVRKELKTNGLYLNVLMIEPADPSMRFILIGSMEVFGVDPVIMERIMGLDGKETFGLNSLKP